MKYEEYGTYKDTAQRLLSHVAFLLYSFVTALLIDKSVLFHSFGKVVRTSMCQQDALRESKTLNSM